MLNEPKTAVWWDMGLGKTATTLTVLNELIYFEFEVSKALVIAPLRVAEDTWTKEAAKWDHLKHLRIVPVLGSRQKREKAMNTPGDIYVINRENVPWLVDNYRKDWPFDALVIDESTSFKNPSSKRFKKLKLVRNNFKYIYELTGTPAAKSFLDLWSQIYLLDGGERLGKTFGAYKERYFKPDKRDAYRIFSWKLKPGAEESIREKISDLCVSLSAEDYLDMPEIIYNKIPVKFSASEMRQYREFERSLFLDLDTAEIDATNQAVLSGKLLQFCNGAVYDENNFYHEVSDKKITLLKELALEFNGEPILCFYSYRSDKERILKAFEKSDLNVRELKTKQDIDDWNAGRIDLLLAHPASTGYGLNLQEGGRVIVWFGLTWQTELYQQANARLYRQGQEKPVIVNLLTVEDSRDEDVYNAITGEIDAQTALLDSLKARIDQYK